MKIAYNARKTQTNVIQPNKTTQRKIPWFDFNDEAFLAPLKYELHRRKGWSRIKCRSNMEMCHTSEIYGVFIDGEIGEFSGDSNRFALALL